MKGIFKGLDIKNTFLQIGAWGFKNLYALDHAPMLPPHTSVPVIPKMVRSALRRFRDRLVIKRRLKQISRRGNPFVLRKVGGLNSLRKESPFSCNLADCPMCRTSDKAHRRELKRDKEWIKFEVS